MTFEQIQQSAEEIKRVLSASVGDGNSPLPEKMVIKLSALVNISSTAAQAVADSKELWRECQVHHIENFIDQDSKLPASTLNDLIKAKCGKCEAQYELCERLDKKISYGIEALRSMISLYKSELENNLKNINQ